MKIDYARYIIILTATLLAAFAFGCSATKDAFDQQKRAVEEEIPSIEITPLQPGNDAFQIVTSEAVTFTVTAPEAKEVQLLHRPVLDADVYIVLARISDSTSGKFTSQMKLPLDFAGDVWAEAVYPNDLKKQTETISIALSNANARKAAQNLANGTESQSADKQSMVTIDQESARSDHLRGKIEKATFREGQSDIAITVNAPAFLLTLWQNGKEVKTYDVGIGRKKFPIVIGERQVNDIIFNPNWIPPDSEWVQESAGVEPYERIEASDPRNPLGSIKIPLGDAYLIHEAAKPSDIGNLVSHGCIRMLKEDIFDLAKKIIAARNLGMSNQEIESLKASNERRAVSLDTPLVVDINYDTQVTEAKALYLYPDVYDRQTNRVEDLYAELQRAGVDISHLDEKTIKAMLLQTNMDEEYVVSIADINAGRALAAGKSQPLT